MNKELLKISIRQNAIYLKGKIDTTGKLNETTSILVVNAAKLGFGFSEELLWALNSRGIDQKSLIFESIKSITGVNKNWTPLVKGWHVPTGESLFDHILTFFATTFKGAPGTTLSCDHTIPKNTFPLERYNGCPYCGTPFEKGEIENFGQGSKLKVLTLWKENDVIDFFKGLLTSKTALDATQVDSLKKLIKHFAIPEKTEIVMKETLMIVIDELVDQDKVKEAGLLLKTPNEILRYLWYKNTGSLQVIAPKTLIDRTAKNGQSYYQTQKNTDKIKKDTKNELRLKYSRKTCKIVAQWLNNLELSAENACEIMHPKRSMWVRFIRALRLAEYSKKKGFESLNHLLDVFYNELYDVWQGQVNYYRSRNNVGKTFHLLKQRPGVFARTMFSNMLWFGADVTIDQAYEIMDKIPARLLYTLNMYAPIYFDKNLTRSVKPLGGINKRISTNKYLRYYGEEQLTYMKQKVEDLTLSVIMNRFANEKNDHKTIYVDPTLFNIPLSIGDRSETVQDLPSALMGTRFPLEGNSIRLFLQWGTGLPAQHLDMDLSCQVTYENKIEQCSYSNLTIAGCQHSGDIQHIPHKVGTAEYINIDLKNLAKADAKFVTFTCNAYTNGSLSPNLVVGWMDSKYQMKVSNKTGVAYDPSCVQHQIRITNSNSKGLVFGVLDVVAKQIIWLEMSFNGQVVQNMDTKGVEALLTKLESKLTIGKILNLKADAQNLISVENKHEADEVYDMEWVYKSSETNSLFLD